MSKRKIAMLISIIATSVAAAIGLTLSIFAWYTNTYTTGRIEVTTNDIILNYQINESSYNIETFDITGLTFFDYDDDTEGKFLPDMAYVVKLDLTNLSAIDLDLNVYQKNSEKDNLTYHATYSYYTKSGSSYTTVTVITTDMYYSVKDSTTKVKVESDHEYLSTNTYYTYDADNSLYTTLYNTVPFTTDGTLYFKKKSTDSVYTQIKSAYVSCIITDTELSASDFMVDSKSKSIEYYATGTSRTDLSTYSVSNLAVGKTTLYVYIFGIQTDDTATNDFLSTDNTYSFTLAIDASMHQS